MMGGPKISKQTQNGNSFFLPVPSSSLLVLHVIILQRQLSGFQLHSLFLEPLRVSKCMLFTLGSADSYELHFHLIGESAICPICF